MLILFGGSFILFGVSILTLKFCNLLKTNGAKGKPKASYAKKVKAKTELNYLEVTEYEKWKPDREYDLQKKREQRRHETRMRLQEVMPEIVEKERANQARILELEKIKRERLENCC